MQPNTASAYPMPFKRQVPINVDTTLSTQQLNGLIVVDSNLAPVIITMPFANTIRAGGFFQILALNGATNPVTVLIQGGDTYNNGQIAALTLDQNAQNLLVAATEDATRWLVLLSVANIGGVETLAQTLIAGNVTGGRDIEVTAGDSIVGEDSVGGAGGDLPFTTGSTTNASSASGNLTTDIGTPGGGGDGGDYVFTGAAGGADAGGIGGAGSNYTVTCGDGGAGTTGGAAGSFLWTCGDGGTGGNIAGGNYTVVLGGASGTAADGYFEVQGTTGGNLRYYGETGDLDVPGGVAAGGAAVADGVTAVNDFVGGDETTDGHSVTLLTSRYVDFAGTTVPGTEKASLHLDCLAMRAYFAFAGAVYHAFYADSLWPVNNNQVDMGLAGFRYKKSFINAYHGGVQTIGDASATMGDVYEVFITRPNAGTNTATLPTAVAGRRYRLHISGGGVGTVDLTAGAADQVNGGASIAGLTNGLHEMVAQDATDWFSYGPVALST